MASETTTEARTAAQELTGAILGRRDARTDRGRRTSPQDHPRASAVGVCAREVYHQITDWQLRPQPDTTLLHRFQRGNEVESIVVRELLADGFYVHNYLDEQITFEIRENLPEELQSHRDSYDSFIICRGHMDGRITWGDDKPVFEVKSLNPNVWGRIESVRDFFSMGSFWVKYPRQMLLYLYQAAEPFGLFILDDCLGHWKILPVVFDDFLDECEDALRTCRKAAIAARTGAPPPYHDDPTVCLECWARDVGVCSPPLDFTPAKFIELHGASINDDIWTTELNKAERAAFNESDKRIKDTMKLYGPGMYVAGDWLIKCEQKRNGFFVTWKRIGGSGDGPSEETPPAES